MEKTPFFSVLVPTYNQAQYLPESLGSLLGQTVSDWEAVVVNDGSTDSTREVLGAYCARDPRFRVIHKENGGVGSALNVGLRHARGQWICWLSSDDLFDLRKLEIHRDWISRYPDCPFFFTHFKELNNATGQVIDSDLWRPIPEKEWQVLEMMRCTYVHGNSICVRRDVWEQAGPFDESLRHGQDFDMWLRLLALTSGTYIPERTCITRVHEAQSSNSFPQMGFFDSSQSVINFLNKHTFPELVPSLDLQDRSAVKQALLRALDVANDSSSWFIYKLGPHPALLLRILEWAWHGCDKSIANIAKSIVRRNIRQIAIRHRGTPFGFLWKVAAAACSLSEATFHYLPVRPDTVAETNYWLLKVDGHPDAEPLRIYLERAWNRNPTEEATGQRKGLREVVIVCQIGQSVSDTVKFGAFRATTEFARYVQRCGIPVVLVGPSETTFGLNEGIPYLGVSDNKLLLRAVGNLAPMDTLVGISRSDILRIRGASRYLVYHHNPARIEGETSVQLLNRSGAPVVTPSNYSQLLQRSYGVREQLLRVVPNGCDTEIFSTRGPEQRQPHTLVFAGHIVPYKGLDVALNAFAIIRKRFPDATFSAYGLTLPWNTGEEHLLGPGMLDRRAFPVWDAIEAAFPGFRYHGEAPQSEIASAFRRHSLLVMPSRIEETFGIVSLEAQACGCIPVLPRQGGFPETLQEGETGYLYERNTAEGLAAEVIRIWEAGLPTSEQRLAAEAWVQNTFSWKNSGEALLGIIESIPERPNRTAYLIHWLFWYAEQARVIAFRLAKGIKVTRSVVSGKRLPEWPGLVKDLWLDRLRQFRAK